MSSDVSPELALLALWEGARVSAKRARLIAALVSGRSATLLVEAPEFRPTSRDWAMARRRYLAVRAMGIAVLPAPVLPTWVTRAPPSPCMLFARGNVELLHRPAIGIVGARNARPATVKWAYDCALQAARQGWVVASGGARGIDAAAHAGAIDAGGQSVAYLGVAADRIYPKSNTNLFARLLRHGGLLVSEHPPRSRTFGYEHARRNRFIAAHASQLFVVEAAFGSGSLGTADYASRLEVPIWVPPREIGGARGGIDALLLAGRARVWPG